jgi:hypothetical protein
VACMMRTRPALSFGRRIELLLASAGVLCLQTKTVANTDAKNRDFIKFFIQTSFNKHKWRFEMCFDDISRGHLKFHFETESRNAQRELRMPRAHENP